MKLKELKKIKVQRRGKANEKETKEQITANKVP